MSASFLKPNFEDISRELRAIPRWVAWKAEVRGGGKPTKVPYRTDLPDTKASTTDPDTWGTFEQAEAAYHDGDRTGIGVVLNGTDNLAGVDIDGCRDAATGAIDPRALALLGRLGAAYVEISPSGAGLRAFGYSEPLETGASGTLDGLKVELYSKGRFLTLTGHTIKSGPLGPLRGFRQLADAIRGDRRPNPDTGELERMAPDERHGELVRRILLGSFFHDSLRDLAASLVAAGAQPGTVVTHLRGLMDACVGPHDGRWRDRRAQIPELVRSAEAKFAPGERARAYLPEADQTSEEPPAPFSLVPVADLEAEEPAPPAFVWENLIPAETVTLLAAHGGTGKSFVSLMLCVAVALGLPLFGLSTRQGKAAFFSGEDGAAVLRSRLRQVCRRMGIDVRDLEGRLFMLDATEHDPRLYCETAGRRDGTLTPAFERLREFVQAEGIGLLVLDNASDTFDASEIDRARVRAFMRALAVLARQAKAGVLLLAHVDKGTSRRDREPNSEGYSGSTAWHNSARSRLFMHRDKEGALLLEHQKGNLSAGLMQPLRLAWVKDGIPVLDGPLSPMLQGMTDRADTRALLKLIHEFTERGEWVATSPNSRTHAGKLLRQERTFPKLKNPEVFDLLRQAERAGQLRREEHQGKDRKWKERWRVTPEGLEFARIAATAATAATSDVHAPAAPGAEPAATAASAAQGVWGNARRTSEGGNAAQAPARFEPTGSAW